MNRTIFLDVETTGLCFKSGHKIIEISALEAIDRHLTGRKFHSYINPQRKIDKEAMNIHKIKNEFLLDKPIFSQIANDFLNFISRDQLVIHNAPFDIGFLNNELKLIAHQFGKIENNNVIIDSLELARKKYPGKRNSLDALSKRFDIDQKERKQKGHGALLDTKMLYEVYICMTTEQMQLNLTKLDEKKYVRNKKFMKRDYKNKKTEELAHNNIRLNLATKIDNQNSKSFIVRNMKLNYFLAEQKRKMLEKQDVVFQIKQQSEIALLKQHG